MENKQFIIALDQGTSGSRAFAVTSDGTVYAQKSAALSPSRPADGLSEYNAQDLVQSQLSVLNALLDEVGPQNVISLAVTSQRSTVVLWDQQTGAALAPVLTWEDGRAFAEAERAAVSQEEVHTVTGLYKTPYFSAPKIAWCLKNLPPVRLALELGHLRVAPVASYLIWKLTQGKTFATDVTLAQRMLLLDMHTKNWSDKLCRAFGITPSVLPQILPTSADYGVYEYKGVSIPITVCAGDQQASVVFTGLAKGESCINYGTGAFLLYNVGKEAVSLPGVLTSLSVADKAGNCDFLLEGPVNAAGSVLAWLNAQGIAFDSFQIDALCKEAKQPVWLLPALGGLGAPYWDFSLSPIAAGLSPRTRKPDWVCGGIRSIAFLVADIAAYLHVNGFPLGTSVKVTGGLSQVGYLTQCQADLLQSEICTLQENESTVLGAARLAAQQAGWKTEKWEPAVSERIFPALSAPEARSLYNRWKTFVTWCKSYSV